MLIYKQQKVQKYRFQKRFKFRGGSNWQIFYFFIFWFLSTTPLKTIPIENVGGVLKNSGNLQQDGHKNFQN